MKTILNLLLTVPMSLHMNVNLDLTFKCLQPSFVFTRSSKTPIYNGQIFKTSRKSEFGTSDFLLSLTILVGNGTKLSQVFLSKHDVRTYKYSDQYSCQPAGYQG